MQKEASQNLNSPIAKHVAVIMDGNNRWQKDGLSGVARATELVQKPQRKLGLLMPQTRHQILLCLRLSSENWLRTE